jgi:endonuclease YncB( thermonuclease family)
MSVANLPETPSAQLGPSTKGERAQLPLFEAAPAMPGARRRFRRRRPLRWLVAAGAIGFVLLRIWQGMTAATSPESLSEGPHEVAEVIDGATLRLANGAVVRLTGVEPPWGSKATDAAEFTRGLLGGKPVRLVFDRERIDRQGRFLAYVEVDGRSLNEELLRTGLAKVRLPAIRAATRKRQLEKAQQEARTLRRGIWGGNGSSAYK